uniref:LRRNT domain-containing protein n=1 Tax=Branchiostoma floridae TaxID=7739 RepID=C3YBH0_BRAFL|eukprot:XP_002606317.1 hypothetical protein BRAFLDRAFT_67558 [Branchiostoma floridae]
MGRRWRHLLMFLLIILKVPNTSEADCSCAPSSSCDCRYKGLTSTPQNLPKSISGLDLRGNRMTAVNQSELLLYMDLIKLNLVGNSIVALGCFPNLQKLQMLYVNNNKITKIHPCTLNLPDLRKLHLSRNQITTIRSGTFANLPRLQELYLSYNKITMIQSGAFASLTRLQHLDLRYNRITGIQTALLANLISLKKLCLLKNNIKMIMPGTFAHLQRLQWLDMSSNQITKIQPGMIGNLPQLYNLDLTSNQISQIQAVFGVVLIGISTIWYMRSIYNSSSEPIPNSISSDTNTKVSVPTIGHDDQYENVDNHHCQAGQGQSQTNTQAQNVGNLSHSEVLAAALKPNPMYTGMGTLPKDPLSTSGHDQTEGCQSEAQSLKVGNLSHDEVLAALKSNPMYTGMGTLPKDPLSTSGHDQTEGCQSEAQSLKVGNLSHDEVLAALKSNPMYTGMGTLPKDPLSTSGHDQTEGCQSEAQSLKVGNLSHDEILAALTPNAMYPGVGNPLKDPPSTRIHEQTGQGQSQVITEANTNTTVALTYNRGHSQTAYGPITESLETKSPECSTLRAVPNPKLNTLYKVVGQYQPIIKSNTNAAYNVTAVTSGDDHQCEDMNEHDQTEHVQAQAINEYSDARNVSYGAGPVVSQPNSLYAN